jgi:hypothetical protein
MESYERNYGSPGECVRVLDDPKLGCFPGSVNRSKRNGGNNYFQRPFRTNSNFQCRGGSPTDRTAACEVDANTDRSNSGGSSCEGLWEQPRLRFPGGTWESAAFTGPERNLFSAKFLSGVDKATTVPTFDG